MSIPCLGVCSCLDHKVVWNTHVGDGGRQEMGRPGRLRNLQEKHPHPGSFLTFHRDWIGRIGLTTTRTVRRCVASGK